MLLHIFTNQEERGNYGGSGFIEIQFCRLPAETKTRKIVSIDNIKHWMDDSLYIHNETRFFEEYGHIFDCGIYCNLKRGIVDIYGINYYSPSVITIVIDKINANKPTEYEVLIDWLEKAKEYNGFYILGV